MRAENTRLGHEKTAMDEKIKENKEKIKLNKQLPYLVGSVVEVTFFLSVEPSFNVCFAQTRTQLALPA